MASPSVNHEEKAIVLQGLLMFDSPYMDEYATISASSSSTVLLPWPMSAYPDWFDKHEHPGQASSLLTATNEYPKGQKKQASRMVRFQLWFDTYHKFFVVVTSCNLVGMALTAFDYWSYPWQNISPFVLGNFLVAILVRNELFGRLLYFIVTTVFSKWTPLRFRLACTSILQHLGGIHSGCATSGFLWLVFRLVHTFINSTHNDHLVILAGLTTSVFVGIAMVSAMPWIRDKYHDVFECHHRFMGWLGLISTWIFVVLSDTYDLENHQWIPGGYQIKSQDFWLVFSMTILVLTPWLTVREVKVDVEIPSRKVAIIRFERGMQQGLLTRISRTALMEYHTFGIVSEGVNSNEHYLICGVQGDFTRDLVENPPRRLWTRELKFAGVSNACSIFRRGIRVCTGTGLGAALSTCLQSPDWFLIWIGSDLEKTFGSTITRLIRRNISPERMILWDTKERGGRPDVMRLIKDTYYSWDAEVVFITSNWQGNREMMEGCKEAGIPAFGTLWDF